MSPSTSGDAEKSDESVNFLVQVKLLDATYRLFFLIAVVQLLVGLSFVYFNWSVANHRRLIIWFILLVMASLPLIPRSHFYFRQTIDSAQKVRAWTLPVLIHALFLGGSWGLAAIWFIDFFYLEYGVVNLMIILGMSFGAGVVIKTSPARAYFYMIPAITGVSYALFQVDIKVGVHGTVVAGIFAYIVLAFMHADYREIVNNIRLSVEISQLHEKSMKDLEARRRLMTAVGHDLRQPLAVLYILLTALSGKFSNGDTDKIIGQMGASISSIDGMLTSLLSAAKLEAGVIQAVNAPVHLRPLCDRLQGEVSTLAHYQNNRLVLDCPDVVIYTDEKMLESILRNLLTNAEKYTFNGEIYLSGTWEEEFFKLVVRDTGQGIDPKKQKRVFEEFTQLDSSDDSYLQGFGLGLAIVARASKLLGFELNLESESGQGACFSLYIPIDRVSAYVYPGPINIKPGLPKKKEGARIVLISPDRETRETLRELLSRWDYDAHITSNLETDKHSSDPNLIIFDGTQQAAAEEVAAVYGAEIPVIIIGDVSNGNNGAKNSLARPVKPAKLRALIRSLLGDI